MKNQSIIEAIQSRVSVPQKQMTSPAPTEEELQLALDATQSAPNHGALECMRFAVVREHEVDAFKKQWIEFAIQKFEEHEQQERKTNMTRILQEVPMFIFVFVEPQGSNIPVYEQEWTTACGVQNMLHVFYQLGYACKWNSLYRDRFQSFKQYFQIPDGWLPMGYVFVGSAAEEHFVPKQRPNSSNFTYSMNHQGILTSA